jgi:hypothetical protein
MEEKDNQAPVFSGETKDWPTFKDTTQMRADKHDTTWLFEGRRSLAEFLARQIKEKTGSDKKARKKALEREKVAKALEREKVIATTYQPRSMRTPMTPSRSGSRTGISRQAYCCRSTRIAFRIWDRTSPTTRSSGSRTRQRSHKPTSPSPEVSPAAEQNGCTASP